ncbi:DUF3667 domain-containing protein [Winogradskyella flava]|uniref:DUF3667 domain-containing protein n=1 Tax=Winogradskyella flava TaxID=1884876 RepID=UPI002493077A|nr:DUF3667 domain-containing protein [Winogradskyella flava]
MICRSCNQEHNNNFCPNCGEKRDVEKITLTSMMSYAFVSVTNMDKGFLLNLKMLLLKPQRITSEYLNGKRKGILNPISFLILSVTLYLVVLELFKIPKKPSDISKLPSRTLETLGNMSYKAGQFIRTYLKFFWILAIIPLGLAQKLIFRKYNFTEHLAISSFIIGQATLVGIISYLILRWPLIFDPVIYIMITWMVYRVFRTNNKLDSLLLAFVVLFLFILQLILITFLIGLSQV